MSDELKKEMERRVVTAPAPSSVDESGAVLSVELGADEDVRWQWTHHPGGRSFVTGYEIIKRANES